MNAYVLIQTNGDEPIARRLETLPGVVNAKDVRGPYDALALTRPYDGLGLDAIVAEIRTLPGVIRALAAPVLASAPDVSSGAAA